MKNILDTRLWHGGDYNPEQWLDVPEVLEEDIRLMKQANINCVSLGIFSWAEYEPKEGEFYFEWLDKIINRLYENKIYTILATPTGALPIWMQVKYPEVRQMQANRIRNLPGNRHNFCYSSPIMREKMRIINEQVAKHYKDHPAIIAWHISNEYGNNGNDSSCHCPECQKAFRSWLKNKYGTIEALNAAWWTKFWSHTYQDWEMIESPAPHGESMLHGLKIDWKRFVSDNIQDFCKEEIKVIRKYSELPTTTNLMGFFGNIDYFKLQDKIDFVSVDAYPSWHEEKEEINVAVETAAIYSLTRSLKRKPFLLMENTPTVTNWKKNNITKRKGMHQLSAMQAIAHGSNSIQYFQWRQSRGSYEKFHGAVIEHQGGEKSRSFKEVQSVGACLKDISDLIVHTCNKSEVAIVFDWENWWALDEAAALKEDKEYVETVLMHFKYFWEKGINIDFIDMDSQYMKDYKLIIAPVNYMYRGDYIEKVREYVHNGGNYVTTYWSGIVDSHDLCYLNERPLEDILGFHVDEINLLSNHQKVTFNYKGKQYLVRSLCELLSEVTANTLGWFENDCYEGYPAITQNQYGTGSCYYFAVQPEYEFLYDFYEDLLNKLGLRCDISHQLPKGVTVALREDLGEKYYFIQNFNDYKVQVALDKPIKKMPSHTLVSDSLNLEKYETVIVTI